MAGLYIPPDTLSDKVFAFIEQIAKDYRVRIEIKTDNGRGSECIEMRDTRMRRDAAGDKS